MAAGRLDVMTRARRRGQELVAEHQDPPMEQETARRLQRFVEEHTVIALG